jgi:hypothetical protein
MNGYNPWVEERRRSDAKALAAAIRNDSLEVKPTRRRDRSFSRDVDPNRCAARLLKECFVLEPTLTTPTLDARTDGDSILPHGNTEDSVAPIAFWLNPEYLGVSICRDEPHLLPLFA